MEHHKLIRESRIGLARAGDVAALFEFAATCADNARRLANVDSAEAHEYAEHASQALHAVAKLLTR